MDDETKGERVLQCKLIFFTDEEGRKRVKTECEKVSDAQDLQEALQEEVIIRVKPAGAVQEEAPVVE